MAQEEGLMLPDRDKQIEANVVFWNREAAIWRNLELPSPVDLQHLAERMGCILRSLILDAGCGPGQWSLRFIRP